MLPTTKKPGGFFGNLEKKERERLPEAGTPYEGGQPQTIDTREEQQPRVSSQHDRNQDNATELQDPGPNLHLTRIPPEIWMQLSTNQRRHHRNRKNRKQPQ